MPTERFFPSERIVAREQFGNLLNDLGLTGEAIEIGTYVGDFALQFLGSWKGKLLHVIDPWVSYPEYGEDCKWHDNLDQKMQIFTERTMMHAGRVMIHRAMSHEVGHKFRDGSLDFIYVDGNHAYEYVKRDLAIYWPKVRPGGIFAGHDFEAHGHWAKDVRRAVLEFAEEHQLFGYWVPGDAHSWYIPKPIRKPSSKVLVSQQGP